MHKKKVTKERKELEGKEISYTRDKIFTQSFNTCRT